MGVYRYWREIEVEKLNISWYCQVISISTGSLVAVYDFLTFVFILANYYYSICEKYY